LGQLTAYPIPTDTAAVNRQAASRVGTPTTVRISSPGVSPKASKPLAYPSA